jgi:carboxymethylenebutenolidase
MNMANKKIIFVVVALLILAGLVYFGAQKGKTRNVDMLTTDGGLEIAASEVNYFETIQGYYARPVAAGSYPGVVMIHEWWGLNENIKDMARELAKEGYMVLAVDLHGGKVAATSAEARELVSKLDQERALENLRAAVAYLRKDGATKIASLGWCFGGGQSLQLAISGEPLDATVIYYGQLTSDEMKLSAIKWPVLGIFGGKDTGIPVSAVEAFGKALGNLGIAHEITIYPNVGHAFANPSGMNYAPEETKDAWMKTLNFLEKNLK